MSRASTRFKPVDRMQAGVRPDTLRRKARVAVASLMVLMSGKAPSQRPTELLLA